MIRRANKEDAEVLGALAIMLWPKHMTDELAEDFRGSIESENGVCFLNYIDGRAVAFAECSLRHDYVEGTDSSPVGYLEGIFVEEAYRKKGAAAELLRACETWAKEKGCAEFASDCELDNTDSLRFHLALGFEEANRVICFTKKL